MTRFQQWVDNLPTTNLKTLVFIVLTLATFALTGLGMLLASLKLSWFTVTPVAVDIYNSWLIFLSAFGGIGVGQYLAKRATYSVPSPDSERAGITQAVVAPKKSIVDESD